MKGLITESEWKGLTLNEAIQKASGKGMIHRIVEEDGRSLMIEADAKSNRINLRLKGGIVTAAFPG